MMNRTIHISFVVVAMLLPRIALANITTSVEADVWFGDTKVDERRRDNATGGNFSFALEHSHPFLPNASFRYTNIDADYVGLDKYDFSFYYRVLEREHMLFDAGISLTQYSNTHYRTSSQPQSEYNFDEFTFNWYAYAELSVPNSDIDIIGQFDFGDRNGMKRADVLAGIKYQANEDIAIRAGYRVIDLEIDNLATSEPEISESLIFINGFFVGAEYRF